MVYYITPTIRPSTPSGSGRFLLFQGFCPDTVADIETGTWMYPALVEGLTTDVIPMNLTLNLTSAVKNLGQPANITLAMVVGWSGDEQTTSQAIVLPLTNDEFVIEKTIYFTHSVLAGGFASGVSSFSVSSIADISGSNIDDANLFQWLNDDEHKLKIPWKSHIPMDGIVMSHPNVTTTVNTPVTVDFEFDYPGVPWVHPLILILEFINPADGITWDPPQMTLTISHITIPPIPIQVSSTVTSVNPQVDLSQAIKISRGNPPPFNLVIGSMPTSDTIILNVS